jgi:hypothetical protein
MLRVSVQTAATPAAIHESMTEISDIRASARECYDDSPASNWRASET